MNRFAWLVLALALLVACVVPGSSSRAFAAPVAQTHSAAVVHAPAHFFDKTRFLVHMGLAYYAFHHWVINVYRAHGFNSGSPHRLGNIAKAGIATIFAYHEVKTAYDIANKSSSKTLHLLITPIKAVLGAANTAGTHLRHGNYHPADILHLASSTGGLSSVASRSGFPIRDIAYKIPGL